MCCASPSAPPNGQGAADSGRCQQEGEDNQSTLGPLSDGDIQSIDGGAGRQESHFERVGVQLESVQSWYGISGAVPMKLVRADHALSVCWVGEFVLEHLSPKSAEIAVGPRDSSGRGCARDAEPHQRAPLHPISEAESNEEQADEAQNNGSTIDVPVCGLFARASHDVCPVEAIAAESEILTP